MQEKKISTDVVRVRLNVWTIIGLILLPFLLFMLYVVLFSECSDLIRKSGLPSKFYCVKLIEADDLKYHSLENTADVNNKEVRKKLISNEQFEENNSIKNQSSVSSNTNENSPTENPWLYNIIKIIIVLFQEKNNEVEKHTDDKRKNEEIDKKGLNQVLPEQPKSVLPTKDKTEKPIESKNDKVAKSTSKDDNEKAISSNVSPSGKTSDDGNKANDQFIKSSSEILTVPTDTLPKNDKNIKTVDGDEGIDTLHYMYYNFIYFSIPNTYICEENGKNLNLLIGIQSDIENFELRQVIRETWAKVARMDGLSYAFIVGISTSDEVNNKLRHESDQYQDLIQVDILARHKYRDANPVMFLKWVTKFCSDVKYVIKADENVFLNIPQIYKFILNNELKYDTMYGELSSNELPDRDLRSEDYVSRKLFPGETYPKFLGHAGYLFPGKFAPVIYNEAAKIAYFPGENILITGIIAAKFNIARENASSQFVKYSEVVQRIEKCEFLKYSIVHQVKAEQIKSLWDEIKSTDFKCYNFLENMLAMIKVDNGSANISDQQDKIYNLLNDKNLYPKTKRYTSLLI